MRKPDLVTGLLVACALTTTVLLVRKELFVPSTPASLKPRRLSNWADLASQGHIMGSRDAKVQLVEFSDFQCPYCAQLKPVLRRLLREHPDSIAVVYRHFPLSRIHPHAFAAAVASECAAAQGRFEEFHDTLYAEQALIGSKPWQAFAVAGDVPDTVAFRRCVADTVYAAVVRRDAAVAAELDLPGTPTIIVDGFILTGPALSDLENRVTHALKRQ